MMEVTNITTALNVTVDFHFILFFFFFFSPIVSIS